MRPHANYTADEVAGTLLVASGGAGYVLTRRAALLLARAGKECERVAQSPETNWAHYHTKTHRRNEDVHVAWCLRNVAPGPARAPVVLTPLLGQDFQHVWVPPCASMPAAGAHTPRGQCAGADPRSGALARGEPVPPTGVGDVGACAGSNHEAVFACPPRAGAHRECPLTGHHYKHARDFPEFMPPGPARDRVRAMPAACRDPRTYLRAGYATFVCDTRQLWAGNPFFEAKGFALGRVERLYRRWCPRDVARLAALGLAEGYTAHYAADPASYYGWYNATVNEK